MDQPSKLGPVMAVVIIVYFSILPVIHGTFGITTFVLAVAWCTSAYGATFVSCFTPISFIYTGILEWLILGDGDICLESGFINIIYIFIIFWGTHTVAVAAATVVHANVVAPTSTSVPESQPDLDTTVVVTILNVLNYPDVSEDEIIEVIIEAEVFDPHSNNSSTQQM
ncbi:hypothetical protein GQ457_07G004860 [Hibiscus cannabinus]